MFSSNNISFTGYKIFIEGTKDRKPCIYRTVAVFDTLDQANENIASSRERLKENGMKNLPREMAFDENTPEEEIKEAFGIDLIA